MITFVVQNETHAFNFQQIVEDLFALGISESEITILHFDQIFGLETYGLVPTPNRQMVKLGIPAPYYRLGGIQRLFWLLRHTKHLQRLVADTRILIVGSDGGIQRCLANHVRSNGGCVILIVDGLLHPWPKKDEFRSRCKNYINRILGRINLNHLVPGDIGHSNLDLIYVMNPTIREILKKQGVTTRIDVMAMPRFFKHLSEYQARVVVQPQPKQFKCLYATGAYKWHGLMTESRYQDQDISDIIQFAIQNPEWSVRIRIHPRESMDDYCHSKSWPANVVISSGSTNVLDDLAWASVVVTARSTLAFEAQLVGLPVLIYTRNFGHPTDDTFFAQDEYFHKSGDLSVLNHIPICRDLLSFEQASDATSISQYIAAMGQN